MASNEIAKLAYLAGIVDGEGTITIFAEQNNRYMRLTLVIANTSPELIDWLHANFRGRVYEHKKYSNRHKQRYDWMLSGKGVKGLVRVILPFLIIKREQAALALEFPILTPGKQHNDTIHFMREQIASELKSLNRRGVNTK